MAYNKSYNSYSNYGNYNGNGNFNNYEKIEMPGGYLIKGGYYDQDNCLKKEFVYAYAVQIAKVLDSHARSVDKSTQIRKFYEAVLNLNDACRKGRISFNDAQGRLLEIRARAHYARERGTVSNEFVHFIGKNVDSVKNPDDLNAFKRHFEAVICYRVKDENRNKKGKK